MPINKASQKNVKAQQATNKSLADIAGKFGGEFWLETQSAIENARKTDKEEIKKLLDIKSNEQD